MDMNIITDTEKKRENGQMIVEQVCMDAGGVWDPTRVTWAMDP